MKYASGGISTLEEDISFAFVSCPPKGALPKPALLIKINQNKLSFHQTLCLPLTLPTHPNMTEAGVTLSGRAKLCIAVL